MFKNLSTEALGVSASSSEIIELALSYGFKSFDLDIVDFSAQVKSQGLAKARRLFESARLKFGSFRLPVRWHEDPDTLKADLDALPPFAELAKELGCTRAITTIEPAGDMRPFHENFEHHRRKLTELGGVLAKYDLRLGTEMLAPTRYREGRAFQFMQTVDQVLMLLKSVTAPNVGMVVDSWHWHLGGGSLDQLRSLGDKVVAVYLADCAPGVTAADADESSRRLPGETGVIDCVGMLRVLAENKYDGPITPRPHVSNFAGQSRDKIVRAAGAAIDNVWKAAGLNSQGKLAAVAN